MGKNMGNMGKNIGNMGKNIRKKNMGPTKISNHPPCHLPYQTPPLAASLYSSSVPLQKQICVASVAWALQFKDISPEGVQIVPFSPVEKTATSRDVAKWHEPWGILVGWKVSDA